MMHCTLRNVSDTLTGLREEQYVRHGGWKSVTDLTTIEDSKEIKQLKKQKLSNEVVESNLRANLFAATVKETSEIHPLPVFLLFHHHTKISEHLRQSKLQYERVGRYPIV